MNKHIANKLIECEDFGNLNLFLVNQFLDNGYGLLFSQFPIRIDIMEDNGKKIVYKYTYLLSNIIPDYQGGYIIEPIGEWENYLENLTIYNSNDIDLFKENAWVPFKNENK